MSRQEIKPGYSFPFNYEDQGSKIAGIFVALFGVVFIAIPIFGMYTEFNKHGFKAEHLLFLIFFAFGLLPFFGGLALFYHEKINIAKDRIFYENKKVFFRSIKWEEPIESYQEILQEVIHHSGGKSSSSYTEHKLTLTHNSNKEKNIKFYNSLSSDQFRKNAESYSKLFNLPLVSIDKDGNKEVRKTSELDQTVQDQIKEGKIKVKFNPNLSTAFESIKMNQTDDKMELLFPLKKIKKIGTLFFIIGAGIVVLGILKSFFLISFGIIFAGMGFGILYFSKGNEVLKIENNTLTYYLKANTLELSRKSISLTSIEEIKIKSNNSNNQILTIISDHATINVGQFTNTEEKEWVKDCILHYIDKAK